MTEKYSRDGKWLCRYSWWASVCCGLMFLMAESALAVTSTQFPISSKEILLAMQNSELPVEGVQVILAAQVNTSTAEPALNLESVVALDGHSEQIKLSCRVHAQCRPFYALARLPERQGSLGAQAYAQLFAQGRREHASSLPVAGDPTGILRAGSHATLVIDEDRLHIRLPVICMQGGTPGDRIRVTTVNRRQTYEAIVLNGAELKGNL